MSGEFFKGIKQWEFDWSWQKSRLPVFYYDNTTMTAIFTASTSRVKALLPHPGMRPIEFYPGRCLAAFTAFEYRKTDINPYNEFSISFPITFNKPQIPGLTAGLQMARRCFSTYVWKLPVTTEIARVGGVELYGYPKFIADIVFKREADNVECVLAEKGQNILTLRGNVFPTTKGKVVRYITYSILDGIPLAANVYVNPLQYAETWDKKAAALTIGTGHAISEALKKIDLSPAPIMFQYIPVNEAILFGGRNLIDN